MTRRVVLALVVLAGCADEVVLVDMEDAVVEVAPVLCTHVGHCFPDDFLEKFGDHDGCVAFVLSNCDDGACDGLTVDRDDLDACIEWLQSGDCDGDPSVCQDVFGDLEGQ